MPVIGLQENEHSYILKGPKLKYTQESSLGRHLLECLKKYGNSIAQVDPVTRQSVTFSHIYEKSISVAKVLQKRNIGQDDVISVCSFNHVDVSLPILAAFYLGIQVAPLDPNLYRHDIKHLLRILNPKLIFCDRQSVEVLQKSLKELQLSIELVVFYNSKVHTPFESFLDEDSTGFEPLDFKDPFNHTAVIVSSSGFTDLPKPVCISHGNLINQLQSHWENNWANFKLMNISTVSTITGIKTILHCLDRGAINVFAPKFEPKSILTVMEQCMSPLGVLLGVNYYHQIVSHPSAPTYDLSSVHIVVVYGGKVSDQYLNKGEKLFHNASLALGYGLTEATGLICSTFQKRDSVGSPEADTEMKIIDSNGAAVGPNIQGEICIRGSRIMMGYFKDKIQTEKAIDKDGWFHTRDIGHYDKEQCFFINGRLDDNLKSKSPTKFTSSDLEEILNDHHDIKVALVTGIKIESDSIKVRAFILKNAKKLVTENTINKYLYEKTNKKFTFEGDILFLEKIPMTSAGKVHRRALLKVCQTHQKDKCHA